MHPLIIIIIFSFLSFSKTNRAFNYELNLRTAQVFFFFSGSGPNLGSYFWVSLAQVDSLTKTLTLNPFTLEEHEESQTKNPVISSYFSNFCSFLFNFYTNFDYEI
jgi:hypothetical protein